MKPGYRLLLISVIPTLLIGNVAIVTVPAWLEKASDERNRVVTAAVYPRWGIDPTNITIDIWGADGSASIADVDRTLFDIAKGLKSRTFNDVFLAYRGSERFRIAGGYFRQLGEERDWQNPVYTMRTLPGSVMTTTGQPAFGSWTGGMLGVHMKQLEDHKSFHQDWWLRNLASSQ